MSISQEESRPLKNKILSSLSPGVYEGLSQYLEPVQLEHGMVLHQPEEPITQVYFINTGLVSILSLLEDGSTIEVAVVGREGLSDTSALLGASISPHQSLVQIPGEGLRMRIDVFKDEVRRNGQFQALLLRYASLLIAQISQVAVCNALHTIEERLARWLLMGALRTESENLPLTQEFISHMLGVRRAGVTVAARTLQAAGLIRYNRGDITILDHEGLEAAACECYQNSRAEFMRYMEFKDEANRF